MMADLEVLLGDWELTASTGDVVMSGGRSSFVWLDGGAFLVQRADDEVTEDTSPEWAANSPMPTVSIIGLDDTAGRFTMLYSDARGVRRVYAMTVIDGVWTIWREAPAFNQRFIGILEDDGDRIAGRWDFSEDGEHWRTDFDLTYRRLADR